MTGARVRWPSLLLACCVCLLAATDIVEAAPLSIADAFKESPILSMGLSGDGRHLAAFVVNDKSAGILIIDRATMKPKVLRNAGFGYPWLVRWVGKDVLLVAARAQSHLYDGEGNLLRLVDGRFLGSLRPDAEGHERIVVADARDYIERIDVRTGSSTKIPFEWPEGRHVRWLLDRDGVPRIATTANRDFTVLTHWVRASATEPWQQVESQLAVDPRWRPIGLSRDGRSLVVLSAEGRETQAVMRYSLEEHALKEVMAGHPSQDIGDAGLDLDRSNSGTDVGNFLRVITLGMKTEMHWFDPKWDALQRSVDAALPGRVNWISGTLESGVVLIQSTGDVDPGTWYVLELGSMSLKRVDATKPEIDREAMRPMQIVRYKSLDGREIPAYLTLPATGDRNLPAIVLVHGGPVVRDRWAWNPEVQMLASRGYAVLQPQFRGSSGFGKSFELAGYGQWGRTMQDDVTAGAEWLVAQGIADPRRMCIYGGSYGGYATLWALVKTPRLFRCGASLAGVSDLNLLLTDSSDTNESQLGRLMLHRYVGLSAGDPRLDEVSPLKNAARIEVPVLLAHGNLDKRVPIAHSEKMVDALRANGKRVEWIYLRGERHGLRYDENRELYYQTLFDFLARNTAPPGAAVSVDPAASSSPRP
ncbi:MAG: S9 family peptidase [Caldimonas sp.]